MSDIQKDDDFLKWLQERREHMLYHKRNSDGETFEMYQSAANTLEDVIKKYTEILPPKEIEQSSTL